MSNNTNFPEKLKTKLKEDLIIINKKHDNILFDYQKNVFNHMIEDDTRGLLIFHTVGTGKCHAPNTPILLYDGKNKMVQDIKVGDLLMGDDSTPRKVLSLASGTDVMYEIQPMYNDKFIVNQAHILCLKNKFMPVLKTSIVDIYIKWIENNKFMFKEFKLSEKKEADIFLSKILKLDDIIEISVVDYINVDKNISKFYTLYSNVINFKTIPTIIPPYIIGLWLGFKHNELLNETNLIKYINEFYRVYILELYDINYSNTLITYIKEHNLMYCKYIPDHMKINDISTRYSLLSGILDGNHKSNPGSNYYYINLTDNTIVHDIIYLCRSLALVCFYKKYNICVYGVDAYLMRSKIYNNIGGDYLNELCYNFEVQFLNRNTYYGFTLDKNNRYVIGNSFLITHNTLTAASVAEHFRHNDKKRDIMVLSPKSLQKNFINGVKKYNRDVYNQKLTEDEIKQSYSFITSNASNMIKQLDTSNKLTSLDNLDFEETNLNNKLIIVDESHTLSNSIVNGSKNGNMFYDLVMKAKNIKLLFLTGTPIVNNSFEIAPILNMCKGYIGTNYTGIYTILPEHYTDFVKHFVDEENNKLKNKQHLQNRIFGLVSYYGEMYKEKIEDFKVDIKKTMKRENFPDRLPLKIIKVEMSLLQTQTYNGYRTNERNENKRAMMKGGSTYRDTLRETIELLDDNLLDDDTVDNKKGGAITKEKFASSTSYRIKSRQTSNVLKSDEKLTKDNIDIYAPKLHKLYNTINKNHKNQPGLIYSSFVVAGLEYMAEVLELFGYKKYDVNEPGPKYALFTGKVDIEERDNIINIFNKPENKTGDLIQLLLVSSTGEKGISLKRTRHLHIMEPQWSYSTLEQVMGRAIRYKSHSDLPTKEQNVQIYMYISDYNNSFLENRNNEIKLEETTDKNLLFRSIKNKELNDETLTLLAETSIDCNLFNTGINFNCYTCASTNKQLYYNDVDIDIKIPSRCKNSVIAEEIIFNGDTYYYTPEMKVFKQNNKDTTYKEILDEELLKKIKKHIK